MAPVQKCVSRPPYAVKHHSFTCYLFITATCLLLVFFSALTVTYFIIYEFCGSRDFFFSFHFFSPLFVETNMSPVIILACFLALLLGSPCAFFGFWFKSHFLREHFPYPRPSQIPVMCFHNSLDSGCYNGHPISLS